jgi:hypothetical protein
VTVSPATAEVAKGGTQQFSATVTGTNNPAQTVTWSVAGGGTGTGINTAGVLTVAAAETAGTLTVTATSTVDTGKSGTATVTVPAGQSPAPTVAGVTVSPATAEVAKGGTQQFSAAVTGTNNPAQTVTWSVAGGGTGTGISAAGLLTVAADENAASLTVTATSTVDTSKSGTATVTVPAGQSPAPTVASVTVSPATAEVAKGGTQQFSAAVTGTNSPAQTVTWTVTGGGTGTGITTAGVLTVAANETAGSLTVTATSTVDNTKSGTATVTLSGGAPPPDTTGVGSVTVEFAGPGEETIGLTGADGDLSWAANTTLTVSVSGGFDNTYRWALDGVVIAGQTGGTLTLHAGALAVKRHTLTVVVTKGGVEYAKLVTFTVGE